MEIPYAYKIRSCDKREEKKASLLTEKASKPIEISPSDRTNGEWVILEPLLPAGKPDGRPRTVDMRAVVLNGIFDVLRSGCAWRMLPRDYPPRSTWVRCPLSRDGSLGTDHDTLAGTLSP